MLSTQDLLDYILFPISTLTVDTQFSVSTNWSRANIYGRWCLNAGASAAGFSRPMEDWDKFSDVSPCPNKMGKILIGMIPQNWDKSSILAKTNQRCNVSATPISIIGCVQIQEYNGAALYTKPITPKKWQQHNIKHFALPFRDFTDEVNINLVLACLLKMREDYLNSIPIYIHCKAGRSRSAVILALFFYMMHDLHPDFSAYDNFSHIESILKQKRPQISIDTKKRELFEAIIRNKYHEWISIFTNPPQLLFNDRMFYELFQAASCKELLILGYEVLHTESYMEMISRKTGFTNQNLCAHYIHELLSDIITTNHVRYHEQGWYQYLLHFNNNNFNIIEEFNYPPLETLLRMTNPMLKIKMQNSLHNFAQDFLTFDLKTRALLTTERPQIIGEHGHGP